MNYKDYKITRDLVWDILMKEQVNQLPVSVSLLCKSLGIGIRYIEDDEKDGFSLIHNGSPRIYVRRNILRARQRFTAAHELGHIMLGHVGKYNLVNREPSATDNPIEQAANVFASRLLAPACVLWGLKISTAEQIARVCDISIAAARFRAERMRILYERNKFLTSQKERQVYKQFQSFIDRYYNN